DWAASRFPAGPQHFWGVPFDLPDPAQNGGRTWVALSADPAGRLPQQVTLTLPGPTQAGGLAVAHCTDVETRDSQVGAWLATYTLIYAEGQRVEHKVRRRFELAARHAAMGTQGFATVPHVEPHPVREA